MWVDKSDDIQFSLNDSENYNEIFKNNNITKELEDIINGKNKLNMNDVVFLVNNILI
jgi:hypothetical protein